MPVFHLYSDTKEKPLKKEEREKLLAELKKKLEEVKELKRKLHMEERELNSLTPPLDFQTKKSVSFKMPEKSVQDLATALEELNVPPLELLKDKPVKKVTATG